MLDRSTFPPAGFYRSYKHDREGPPDNNTYEVLGVGSCTDDGPYYRDKCMVVYRPLTRDAFTYQNGKLFDLKLLEHFLMHVEIEGEMVPRFIRITDKAIIARLEKLRDEMYN